MTISPSNPFTPVTPFGIELSTLEFSTEKSWTAYDFQAVLGAIDSLYCTFIVTRHLSVLVNERKRLSWEQWSRNVSLFDRNRGPEPIEEYFYYLERLSRRNPELISSLLWGGIRPALAELLPHTEVSYYLDNPGEYLSHSQELRIHKISIASPGFFTLIGVEGAMVQVRELIKDLWYRNAQEQAMGNLEIMKKKLELVSQHNLNPEVLHLVTQDAGPAIETLSHHKPNLRLKDSEPSPSSEPPNAENSQRTRRPPKGKR